MALGAERTVFTQSLGEVGVGGGRHADRDLGVVRGELPTRGVDLVRCVFSGGAGVEHHEVTRGGFGRGARGTRLRHGVHLTRMATQQQHGGEQERRAGSGHAHLRRIVARVASFPSSAHGNEQVRGRQPEVGTLRRGTHCRRRTRTRHLCGILDVGCRADVAAEEAADSYGRPGDELGEPRVHRRPAHPVSGGLRTWRRFAGVRGRPACRRGTRHRWRAGVPGPSMARQARIPARVVPPGR